MKLLPFLLLFCCTALGQTIHTLYYEDFEDGSIPPNWEEWSVINNATNTWRYGADPLAGTNSIQFNNYGAQVDLGAFYNWPTMSVNEIYVQFMFKTTIYPIVNIIEIIDLYDDYSHEICNIYVNTTGHLILFLGFNSVIMTEPIPEDTPIWIWLHYVNDPTAHGTAAWSTNSTEPTSGDQFTSLGQGYYHTPVSKLLLGPVAQAGVTFYYDELTLSVPMVAPTNLRVTGGNQMQGSMSLR